MNYDIMNYVLWLVLVYGWPFIAAIGDLPDYYHSLSAGYLSRKEGPLPTVTEETPNASDLFIEPHGFFFCDSCQSLLAVARLELQRLMGNQTHLSGVAKFDVLVESLLMKKQVCLMKSWIDFAQKLDMYAVEDLRRSCYVILEENENAVANSVGMRKGLSTFAEAATELCVKVTGLCSVDSIWPSVESVTLRENRVDRYRRVSMKFLEDNKKRSTVLETNSGLQHSIIRQGSLENTVINDSYIVSLLYNATLLNGLEFRSQTETPVNVTVSELPDGIREGLKLTGAGGEAILYIPSQLAFGNEGQRRMVAPEMAVMYRYALKSVSQGGDTADILTDDDIPTEAKSELDELFDDFEDPDFVPIDIPTIFGDTEEMSDEEL